jgi:hypothetical protein
MCCIRSAGRLDIGDLLLTETTFDEAGERLEPVIPGSDLYANPSRTRFFRNICERVEIPQPEDYALVIQPGLYELRWDKNWPGAPMMGVDRET